jgi:hypothetical protein
MAAQVGVLGVLQSCVEGVCFPDGDPTCKPHASLNHMHAQASSTLRS